ncbi:MAG: DUF488 domain-containing protein [Novosphingobium sp.]|nr:DUF488 domain-containing protein [Novosphingobium sp.]
MVSTIGYERASLPDFIATLKLGEIDILVDIRDRAQSRRPGFSKSALNDALAEAGIDYLHLPALGDPKEGREAARKGNYAQFRAIFNGVMETSLAREALAELENLALNHRICLMCFERDQTKCHRKMVADHLETSLDLKARHLGVKEGAGRTSIRRMRDIDQGATASI